MFANIHIERFIYQTYSIYAWLFRLINQEVKSNMLLVHIYVWHRTISACYSQSIHVQVCSTNKDTHTLPIDYSCESMHTYTGYNKNSTYTSTVNTSIVLYIVTLI